MCIGLGTMPNNGAAAAGRGRLGGGARPAALECGVLRVAECVALRAAKIDSLIRSSNAVEGRRCGR